MRTARDLSRRTIRRAMKMLLQLKELYSFRDWMLLVLPLAISTTFLVGIGPQLQESALSILNTGAPSIYEAAYKNGIAAQPSLDAWLLQCLHPLYISIALIVSVYSLRKRSVGAIIVAMALSLCISYTVVDTLNIVRATNFDASWLLLNIASNTIGGIALGLVCALLLTGYRDVRLFISAHAPGLLVVAPIALIMLGVAISSFAHFATRFLYNPMPIEVSFDTKDAIRGHYSTSGKLNVLEADEKVSESFSWLSDDLRAATIVVEPFQDSSDIKWSSIPGGKRYRVEFRMFSNCESNPRERIIKGEPYLTIDHIGKLEAPVMEGPKSLTLLPTDAARITQYGGSAGSFWTKPTRTGKVTNQDLRLFNLNGGLKGELDGELTLVFRPGLFDMTKEYITPKDKALDIVIDGKRYRHYLPSILGASPDTKVACKAIQPSVERALNGGASMVPAPPSLWTEIFVRIVPLPDAPSRLLRFDQVLDFRPFQGTVDAYSVGAPTGSLPQPGLTRLSIRTGAGTLVAGGASSTLGNMDTLDLWGNLEVVVSEDRTFISGTAEGAWKGGKRLNKTKWELLQPDWQLWIVGGIFAAALAGWGLARRSVAAVLSEDVFTWL